MGWEYLWILALVAAVLCSSGFYKYVYFLSVGYGLAVAGIGASLMIMFGPAMAPVDFVLCIVLVLYGARLSVFLIYREAKSAGYRGTLGQATKLEKPMPVGVKLTIWIGVAVLYVLQTMPVFYRLYNRAADRVLPWIGAAIALCGLAIETLADLEKSAQKKTRPDMAATKGLYRMVRCPNYFGEIVFWTGIFVCGLKAFNFWGQWLGAAFSYLCIIAIMFNGASRLEKRQEAHYGSLPEYRAYADSTPIILPFLPIYHLTGKMKK